MDRNIPLNTQWKVRFEEWIFVTVPDQITKITSAIVRKNTWKRAGMSMIGTAPAFEKVCAGTYALTMLLLSVST